MHWVLMVRIVSIASTVGVDHNNDSNCLRYTCRLKHIAVFFGRGTKKWDASPELYFSMNESKRRNITGEVHLVHVQGFVPKGMYASQGA